MIVSGGERRDRNIRLWEIASGQERLAIDLKDPSVDRRVPRLRQNRAILREEVVTMEGEMRERHMEVSFSPDNRLAASGGGDGIVQLWDAVTGERLHKFPTGQGVIQSLAFAPDGKSLAAGNKDTTVLIWDVTPWTGRKNDVVPLLADEMQAYLSALADINATKAYEALGILAAASDQAVPLLAELLRPAPAVDSKRVTRLLTDLDSDDFQVRSRAQKELEKMAEAAEPFLRRALKSELSLEARRRVEELLAPIEEVFKQTGGMSRRLLQLLRGVEVLERIGTPAARQALQKVAEMPPNPDIGAEAKAALDRLAARRVR
jgi:WD domain, G-beta repeat